VVSDSESVCEEIKTILREEIISSLISSRDIERYCPGKWKRKTRPKRQENDKTSISNNIKQLRHIVIDVQEKPILERAKQEKNDIDHTIQNQKEKCQLYDAQYFNGGSAPLTKLESASNQDVEATQMKKEELSQDIRFLEVTRQYQEVQVQIREEQLKRLTISCQQKRDEINRLVFWYQKWFEMNLICA
jgi:hypothetical protein